jgi:Bacterial CdiA-CT RNAse A domain
MRLRRWFVELAVAGILAACFLAAGCGPNHSTVTPFADGASPSSAVSKRSDGARRDNRGITHDLSVDEQAGGHTLRKHVGRSDDELKERLDREGISASSTYTDRAAAEYAVGSALQEGQSRIEQWMARSGGHPNLVLDYRGDQPIGRTLHRGESSSQPCADAKVVLRWLSSSEYYVLTSYPECR